MSSAIFPWCSEYRLSDLRNIDQIQERCKFAGDLARAYNQRVTFHPSHYVCLASPKPHVVKKSIMELEAHSDLLDLMGYEPSLYNKCNIHVGGSYGDRASTLLRFAENFQLLSPNCKRRLAVENDDKPNEYSIEDLLPLANELGIAVTWDLHHQRFCTREFSA